MAAMLLTAVSIIPTAFLREDGIEMIRDRGTGLWFIRTVSTGLVDQTWYWHPKSKSWVRPFIHPAREYYMSQQEAEHTLNSVRYPGKNG